MPQLVGLTSSNFAGSGQKAQCLESTEPEVRQTIWPVRLTTRIQSLSYMHLLAFVELSVAAATALPWSPLWLQFGDL